MIDISLEAVVNPGGSFGIKGPFLVKALHELTDYMIGIGGTPSVAAYQQLVPIFICGCQGIVRCKYSVPLPAELGIALEETIKMFFDTVFQSYQRTGIIFCHSLSLTF